MKKRILVVEDNRLVRGSVTATLKDAGYEVWSVETAESALELLLELPVDLIVTDYRLPGMDGVSLLARLQTLGSTSTETTRMVIYSAAQKPVPQPDSSLPETTWIPKSAGHTALLRAIRGILGEWG